ncbi:hypothetical protein GF377_03075, partial [candidate division GN15 bacterium]|nr:hypothetical protein [candidate division GN15 bacterium]
GVTVLGIVVVAICNSRGPVLALGLVLVMFGWMIGKIKYVLAVIALGVVAALIAFPGMAREIVSRFERDFKAEDEWGRLAIYQKSLAVIEDYPVFGVGLGNFEAEYLKHVRDTTQEINRQKHAHNDLLNVWAVSGLPALLFFVGMWLVALRFQWLGYRSRMLSPPYRYLSAASLIASVAFIVISMTEATFADEEVRQILMITWAAGLAGWYPSDNAEGAA